MKLKNNIKKEVFEKYNKILKIMKISTVLLFICTFGLLAGNAHSQNSRFSVNLTNASIEKIISEIEKNEGYVFIYNEDAASELKKQVSVRAKDESIDEVLDKMLKNTDLAYSVKSKQVTIYKKERVPAKQVEAASAIQPQQNQQTGKRITGTVVDANGEPVIGANIIETGTTNGTVTDVNGNFSLQVDNNASLKISYIGYLDQNINTAGLNSFNITLQEDMQALDEVVVIGYGTQKRGNLTGSIATISNKELTKVPLSSPTNALGGKLPGLIAVQRNGIPGGDAAELSIRGYGNALVIVDGIESDFRYIDPNQIESISILKDASSSIYGSRAGNGVILVTTKRGDNSKPVLTFNSAFTLQGITVMPQPVSSGQYAEIRREAHLNAGLPIETAPFTQEQINKYYAGNDPDYPNTNWYDYLIRKWAPQQQYNLSIRGGSDKIRYYSFLGYTTQETVFKKNGGNYNRYNFQTNIDANILDNLLMQLTLNSIIEDRDYTVRQMFGGNASVWYDFWFMLPTYSSHFPDPTKLPFAGGGTGGAHATSNQEISGYNRDKSQTHRGSLALNYDFNFLRGLSFRTYATYSTYNGLNKIFEKPVTYYSYNAGTNQYSVAGAYGTSAKLTQSSGRWHTVNTQTSLSFNRIFNGVHNFSAMALYETTVSGGDTFSAYRENFLTEAIDQLYAGSTQGMSNDGSAWEMGRASYVFRTNYSYKDKYLLEAIIRADASARFPKATRWGYFPAVSAGWRIDQEGFMSTFGNLDNLKLRASYGEAGNDAIGNFQYLSGYGINSLPYLLGNSSKAAIYSRGLANPNMTWEKIKTYNAGIDFSFFNRKLYGEADLFYRQREGILATRIATVPSSFGATLPPENINSLNDRGFEFLIGSSGRTGDFGWDISGNISWSRSKWEHFEEPDYSTDADQKRLYQQSGNWTDRFIGYVSDGLFTSQEQIDNLKYTYPNGNNTLKPGDIVYLDLNDDGVLDWRDQKIIGKGAVPHWMTGLNIGLTYKDFDLSLLLQGSFGFYNNIWMSRGEAGITYYDYIYTDRWTENNNNKYAAVPRMGGASSNDWDSDYRYKKADYLRLKNTSLGYNLPKSLLKQINLQQVRFYISAVNMLTFTGLKKFHIDPEAPNGQGGQYYPQQKSISLGINLSF